MHIMKKIYKNLREYIIYGRRVTISKASQQIGISRQFLSDIINGNVIPGFKASYKIQMWSNGKFKAAELMGMQEPKERS